MKFSSTLLALASVPLLGAPPAPVSTGDTFAEPLVKAVAEIAAKDTPSAKDFARMTDATLDFVRRKSKAGEGFSQDVVHSGLDGVDAGEKLDPKLADWPSLRKELQAYLNEPKQEPPPQKGDSKEPPPEDKNPENKEQDADSKDDANDSKQSKKSDQDSKSSDSKSGNDKNESQPENSKSDPQDGKSDESKNEKSKNAGDSAFGDMNKPPASPPPPPSPEEKSIGAEENQQVGGQQKKENAADVTPQLVMPLQKLEQLKQQDSPAKLFRLMEGEAAPGSAKKGKTW